MNLSYTESAHGGREKVPVGEGIYLTFQVPSIRSVLRGSRWFTRCL